MVAGGGGEVFMMDACGGWGRNGFVTEDSCICNSARLGIGASLLRRMSVAAGGAKCS